MGEKANLRKHLESWRGKPYTAKEISEGVALHKLVGAPSLIQVAHKVSGAGRTYAIVQNIIRLPRGMAPLEPFSYERSPHWADKAKGYADAVARWKAEYMPAPKEEFPPLPEEPDDDLPF